MISDHIKGLGPVLLSVYQVLNLQYADDIIIFLHADKLMLEKLKWIFITFLGLHINFSKTEFILVNFIFDQASFYCSILIAS
jgi:hypothetical protein